MVNNGESNKVHFSIPVFKFVGSEHVYLQCQVSFCLNAKMADYFGFLTLVISPDLMRGTSDNVVNASLGKSLSPSLVFALLRQWRCG